MVQIQAVRSVIKISIFKVDHVFAWLISTLQLKGLVFLVNQHYKDAQLAKTIHQQLQHVQHVIVLGTILWQENVKNALHCVVSALDLTLVLIVNYPHLILSLTMEFVFVTLTLDQIYT